MVHIKKKKKKWTQAHQVPPGASREDGQLGPVLPSLESTLIPSQLFFLLPHVAKLFSFFFLRKQTFLYLIFLA